MHKYLFFLAFSFLPLSDMHAQCFASSGNPVGGTENMGVLSRNMLRLSTFYRFAWSARYFNGSQLYEGEKGILQNANYNYTGFLTGYGLTDKLSVDAEAGYFINKTQLYKIEDTKLTGRGLSNLVVSVKPRLFYNPATRFEVSCALGANIPFSTTLQQVNYVTLPIDIQPSTGSYGIVFQSYVIKENSFKASRFFFTNRIEKYFKNIHGWEFGTLYLNSVFYSKHYVFSEKRIKDWTFILQLRNQIREKNVKDDQTIFASGNVLFFLIPQVNISIQEKWNISVLTDIPLYQHYNEVQLAHNVAFAIALIRDISFGK